MLKLIHILWYKADHSVLYCRVWRWQLMLWNSSVKYFDCLTLIVYVLVLHEFSSLSLPIFWSICICSQIQVIKIECICLSIGWNLGAQWPWWVIFNCSRKVNLAIKFCSFLYHSFECQVCYVLLCWYITYHQYFMVSCLWNLNCSLTFFFFFFNKVCSESMPYAVFSYCYGTSNFKLLLYQCISFWILNIKCSWWLHHLYASKARD